MANDSRAKEGQERTRWTAGRVLHLANSPWSCPNPECFCEFLPVSLAC